MKNFFITSVTIICLLFISLNGYSQTTTDKYKIELKLLTPTISLSGDKSNLVFTVTVTNLTSKPVDFGSTLHYGYKKYNNQDFYLEAQDKDNNKVDIDGNDDNDLFFDDPLDTTKNTNKITQKIITGAYNFSPGSYRIRWVYDPFDNLKNPNQGQKILPIYSNWEALTVTQ